MCHYTRLLQQRGFLSLKEHFVLLFRECYSRQYRCARCFLSQSGFRGFRLVFVLSLSFSLFLSLSLSLSLFVSDDLRPLSAVILIIIPRLFVYRARELYTVRGYLCLEQSRECGKHVAWLGLCPVFLRNTRTQWAYRTDRNVAFHNGPMMNCLLLRNGLIYLTARETRHR